LALRVSITLTQGFSADSTARVSQYFPTLTAIFHPPTATSGERVTAILGA
jgi:hypothetical protein